MILNARTTAQWIKKFRHIISLRKYSLFGPEALGASICGQCLFLCELLLYKVPGLALDALDWEAHWWALIRFLWKIRVEVGHYLNTPVTVTTNCENTLERLIPQKLNYSIGIAASGRCMVIPPKVMKTLLYIYQNLLQAVGFPSQYVCLQRPERLKFRPHLPPLIDNGTVAICCTTISLDGLHHFSWRQMARSTCSRLPSLKLTVRPWKWMVGRRISYWTSPFSGDIR